MKLGIVVVTHGQLATELVNSAEMIVGDLPHFAAVSIGWHEDVEHAREAIGAAIERVGASAGGTTDEPASAAPRARAAASRHRAPVPRRATNRVAGEANCAASTE